MAKLKTIKNILINYLTFSNLKHFNILNSVDTLNYIIKNKCSIGRLGDGELQILKKENIGFQTSNHELSKKLASLKTTDKFLLCIPNAFNKNSLTNLTEEELVFWKKQNKISRYFWHKYFGKNKIMGDAFISRFYIRYKDKSIIPDLIQSLKKLWNNRNVVFVEGSQTRLGIGNDLFNNAKSIKRILCPPTNAFDFYDQIKNSIYTNCKKDDLIIMALGPTASVLSYDCSNDFQCLDLGHIDIEYEWFKTKVTTKTAIKNKFVNEVKNGTDVSEIHDEVYLKQIIDKIGC